MLGVLGLTPHEEAVYRLMLGRPAVTAGEMATQAGLSEQVALRAIERMVGTGLITATTSGMFCAAPPAVALGSLISARRDRPSTPPPNEACGCAW